MQVLKKPLITEKATKSTEKNNRYSFVVDKDANKIQIRKEVEKMYGVSVGKVWTMLYPRIKKNIQRRRSLHQSISGFEKRAIVQVAEGEVIDFYAKL